MKDTPHPFRKRSVEPTEAQLKITETLIKLHRGQLTPEHEARIKAHLNDCENCQKEYEEIIDFLDDSKNEEWEKVNPERVERTTKMLERIIAEHKAKMN